MNIASVLHDTIIDVPDWPKPGVQFKDLTPILQRPQIYNTLIDYWAEKFADQPIDVIAALDARGFWFAPALSQKLSVGWVPIRKAGKLPRQTYQRDVVLEYGESTLELHCDDVKKGQRVLLVDDLIATGGTLCAAIELLQECEAEIVSATAVVDLSFLGGSRRIADQGVNVTSVISY